MIELWVNLGARQGRWCGGAAVLRCWRYPYPLVFPVVGVELSRVEYQHTNIPASQRSSSSCTAALLYPTVALLSTAAYQTFLSDQRKSRHYDIRTPPQPLE